MKNGLHCKTVARFRMVIESPEQQDHTMIPPCFSSFIFLWISCATSHGCSRKKSCPPGISLKATVAPRRMSFSQNAPSAPRAIRRSCVAQSIVMSHSIRGGNDHGISNARKIRADSGTNIPFIAPEITVLGVDGAKNRERTTSGFLIRSSNTPVTFPRRMSYPTASGCAYSARVTGLAAPRGVSGASRNKHGTLLGCSSMYLIANFVQAEWTTGIGHSPLSSRHRCIAQLNAA